MFPWIRGHEWAGIPNVTKEAFPLLTAWLDRIEARPGTDRGLGVPERGKKNKSEEEQKKEAEAAQKWIFNDQNK